MTKQQARLRFQIAIIWLLLNGIAIRMLVNAG